MSIAAHKQHSHDPTIERLRGGPRGRYHTLANACPIAASVSQLLLPLYTITSPHLAQPQSNIDCVEHEGRQCAHIQLTLQPARQQGSQSIGSSAGS